MVFGYGVFVFWLLTKPKIFEGAPPIPYVDTLGHFLLFAGMSGLIYWGILRSEPRTSGWVLFTAAFLGSTMYGAMLEVVQISIPLRTFEWGDVAANSLGALAATVLADRRMRGREKKGQLSGRGGDHISGGLMQ